jgi:hypothetical protein
MWWSKKWRRVPIHSCKWKMKEDRDMDANMRRPRDIIVRFETAGCEWMVMVVVTMMRSESETGVRLADTESNARARGEGRRTRMKDCLLSQVSSYIQALLVTFWMLIVVLDVVTCSRCHISVSYSGHVEDSMVNLPPNQKHEWNTGSHGSIWLNYFDVRAVCCA